MSENNVIRTLKEIHPEKIYVTSEQYKAIKSQKHKKPFHIEDEDIANALLISSLIKKEEVMVNENAIDEDGDLPLPIYKSTGRYLLTPDGEYYIDYRKNKNRNNFKNEFRAWVTLVIAIAGLALSVYSIYLTKLAAIK